LAVIGSVFCELAPLFAAADRDEDAIAAIRERHALDIDPSTVPVLAELHGLRHG